jgi:hypothetical protein
MRKKEITSQYNRSPLTTVDHQKHDFGLCAIVRGSKNQCFGVETSQTLKEIRTPYEDLHKWDQERRRIRLRSLGVANDTKEDTPTELKI